MFARREPVDTVWTRNGREDHGRYGLRDVFKRHIAEVCRRLLVQEDPIPFRRAVFVEVVLVRQAPRNFERAAITEEARRLAPLRKAKGYLMIRRTVVVGDSSSSDITIAVGFEI